MNEMEKNGGVKRRLIERKKGGRRDKLKERKKERKIFLKRKEVRVNDKSTEKEESLNE